MNFFKLFTASPLFCVPSFRGTLLAVPSMYREYTEVIVANETIKSKRSETLKPTNMWTILKLSRSLCPGNNNNKTQFHN